MLMHPRPMADNFTPVFPSILNCITIAFRKMEDYIINVGKIEEWQTIKDIDSLDKTFQRAKRTLVGGGTVALVREQRDGRSYRFEEFTDLDDFETYRKNVYKYLA